MLKLKDNIDLEELKKYDIYPYYICNEHTGETMVSMLEKIQYSFRNLKFRKIKKRVAKLHYTSNDGYFLILEDNTKELMDLDLLYDLIKADLVEKVKL